LKELVVAADGWARRLKCTYSNRKLVAYIGAISTLGIVPVKVISEELG